MEENNATGPATPPAGATKEDSPVNIHPMSVESKHLIIGALVGLVIGLFIGYWEMHRQGKGWGYIAGFGVGGLLLGLGIGFAIPPRKKVVVKSATGKEECYFVD